MSDAGRLVIVSNRVAIPRKNSPAAGGLADLTAPGLVTTYLWDVEVSRAHLISAGLALAALELGHPAEHPQSAHGEGVGMGAVYYAALYYGLAVGHADVDAGGTHEGLIGVGYCLGPLVALAGVPRSESI